MASQECYENWSARDQRKRKSLSEEHFSGNLKRPTFENRQIDARKVKKKHEDRYRPKSPLPSHSRRLAAIESREEEKVKKVKKKKKKEEKDKRSRVEEVKDKQTKRRVILNKPQDEVAFPSPEDISSDSDIPEFPDNIPSTSGVKKVTKSVSKSSKKVSSDSVKKSGLKIKQKTLKSDVLKGERLIKTSRKITSQPIFEDSHRQVRKERQLPPDEYHAGPSSHRAEARYENARIESNKKEPTFSRSERHMPDAHPPLRKDRPHPADFLRPEYDQPKHVRYDDRMLDRHSKRVNSFDSHPREDFFDRRPKNDRQVPHREHMVELDRRPDFRVPDVRPGYKTQQRDSDHWLPEAPHSSHRHDRAHPADKQRHDRAHPADSYHKESRQFERQMPHKEDRQSFDRPMPHDRRVDRHPPVDRPIKRPYAVDERNDRHVPRVEIDRHSSRDEIDRQRHFENGRHRTGVPLHSRDRSEPRDRRSFNNDRHSAEYHRVNDRQYDRQKDRHSSRESRHKDRHSDGDYKKARHHSEDRKKELLANSTHDDAHLFDDLYASFIDTKKVSNLDKSSTSQPEENVIQSEEVPEESEEIIPLSKKIINKSENSSQEIEKPETTVATELELGEIDENSDKNEGPKIKDEKKLESIIELKIENSEPSAIFKKPLPIIEGSPVSPSEDLKEEEEAEITEEKAIDPLNRFNIRERCALQLIDKKFLTHLSEMHPTSALHELCTRLEWPSPVLSSAFECGPPMGRMYIFKAVVNGNTYQPTVAVDNKKDAKANAAWYTLQEMGFLNKNITDPL